VSKGDVTVHELSRAQQALVRRVAEAKATVPEFTLATTAVVDAALAAVASAPDVGLDDLVVKAAALALRAVPRANGAYRDGRWELYDRVNVAVTVFTEAGVVAPVIADADARSVTEIATQSRALAERARAGAITSPELASATFTVSSLGATGVDAFTAILVPPQAAALAAGGARPAPIVRDGAVSAGHVLDLNVTCDARILYGEVAGNFLRRIADALADPAALGV
jgi:pyruvate dehydrogenase E2 component (dihydrolipoamide acetyltransferase)